MIRERILRMRTLGAFGVLALVCAGCASSNNNPTPVINSIAPASVPAGSGSVTLNISGTNINNASVVELNGTQLLVAGVQQPPCGNANPCPVILTVVVPATQTVSAGSFPLNVTTAGRRSKDFSFNVLSPQIVGESPVAVPAGSGSFALSLIVLNAVQTVQVQFGAPGAGSTTLTPQGPVTCNTSTACNVVVAVPAESVKTAATLPVTIVNPNAQSGGTASTTFVVTAASGQFPLAISSASGAPGNAGSTHSAVSDGGAFVVFDSTATNLTGTPTNGLSQVYLQTNCFTGGTCSAGTTLISGASGAAGSGGVIGSDKPAISADGRFVVFESDDTNLVAGATQAVQQIYLFDTCNGVFGAVKNCTPKMTLVSTNGSAPGDGPSTNPAISASGMFIAFQSLATNLTSAAVPANTQQVYLFRTCNGVGGPIAGCTPGLQLVSIDANGNPGDADSTTPALDPAGLAVAFESQADNILAGMASNGSRQIYIRTTCLEGVPFLASPCGAQTALVSGDASNRLGTGDSITPELADNNGSLLAVYATSAGNLLPSGATGPQIVGTTICFTLPGTTSCSASGTRVLSLDQSGLPGNGASSNPSVSGVKVVFTSQAALASGVSGQQVYGVTVCVAPGTCSTTAKLISADSTGAAIGGDFGAVGSGGIAAFSTTGSASSPGVAQVLLAAPF